MKFLKIWKYQNQVVRNTALEKSRDLYMRNVYSNRIRIFVTWLERGFAYSRSWICILASAALKVNQRMLKQTEDEV